MSRKVTIYDIAKYLRISAATVSYVLNDDPNTVLCIFANPLESEVMTKEESNLNALIWVQY